MNNSKKHLVYLFSLCCLLFISQTSFGQGENGGNNGGDGGGNTDVPVEKLDNTTTQPSTNGDKSSTDLPKNTDKTGDDVDTDDADTDEKEEKKEDDDDERKIKFDERQGTLPEAKIWGQHLFRDQSISLFTRSRDIKAIDSYLLGAGDELQINVWGATAYSANTQIDEEGFIELSYPEQRLFIPRIYVKNMTFAEAKKAIISRLSRHMDIRGSQHSIELNYSRSLTVNITGEVFFPGSYTMPAVNTAFNALVASGGPSQIGSVRKIKVVSADKEERILDVYKFMNNPNVADEFFLQNNDYIFVPLADRVVEVRGAVKRPYFYELIEGEELRTLIKYAGKMQPDAYRRNIQVIRYINDEERLIDINLAQLIANEKDFELLDGDVIQINPIKQAYSNYITVEGAVKLPGSYELKENTRVRDALFKAGIIRSAVMERIYIKRLQEDLSLEYLNINVYNIIDSADSKDNILLNPFDVVEVKYKSEFIDKYNIRVFGSVRKPGEYEYSDNLSLADLLYMSNGIQKEAANSYLEISRLQMTQDSNHTYMTFKKIPIGKDLKITNADQIFLEPYDQVFVRQSKEFDLPQNIAISGEVLWPGQYTLASRDERVYDLIERAGGFTSVAFLEGAKLFRKGDGQVLLNLKDLQEKGEESRYNYLLQEGDRIVVPRAKNLVAIAGRVNHPEIKDQSEIDEAELELELEKQEDDIARKEILLEDMIKRKNAPNKINVPYTKGKNARYYLREYVAGIDRQNGGRARLVYVRYPDGSVQKSRGFLFFRNYPEVTPGSMIFVDTKRKKPKKYKEKDPPDVYKVVTDVLAVMTSAVLIYAIISGRRIR